MFYFLPQLLRRALARWPFPWPRIGERRRFVRHSLPALRLKIEGQRLETLDWSLGGCKIAGFHRPLSRGDQLQGRIAAIGGERSGEFLAEVMYVSEEIGIGLCWVEMASATYHALRRLKYH
jgi:hypothetical protein